MNRPELTWNRRDWFRLRRQTDEAKVPVAKVPAAGVAQRPLSKPAGASSELGTKTALQPVAHPPNHDGMDLAALPSMREAELSLDEVLALLMDIETYGAGIGLVHRDRSPSSRLAASDVGGGLEFARAGILNGTLSRFQIRYAWQDAWWIDTLTANAHGFRLVRIEHR